MEYIQGYLKMQVTCNREGPGLTGEELNPNLLLQGYLLSIRLLLNWNQVVILSFKLGSHDHSYI